MPTEDFNDETLAIGETNKYYGDYIRGGGDGE